MAASIVLASLSRSTSLTAASLNGNFEHLASVSGHVHRAQWAVTRAWAYLRRDMKTTGNHAVRCFFT